MSDPGNVFHGTDTGFATPAELGLLPRPGSTPPALPPPPEIVRVPGSDDLWTYYDPTLQTATGFGGYVQPFRLQQPGGTGGPTGPTQAELDIARRQNDLTERGQDLDNAINEANVAIQQRRNELEEERQALEKALADQNHVLAQQIEKRIAENEVQLRQLERDSLALSKERFGLEQQGFALEQQMFKVQQQQFQQQFALSQQRLGLDAQGQQISGVLGAGNLQAGLASSLGNIEAQRAQFLSELAANPRDFEQLNIMLGGPQGSFLSQLAQGEQVGPQSTRNISGPTLGAGFQRLLDAVLARPDLDLFNQASARANQIPSFGQFPQVGPEIPQFGIEPAAAPAPAPSPDAPQQGQFQQALELMRGFAGGGKLITDEPIIAYGVNSGQPRFSVGEAGPEEITIKPIKSFAHGGSVETGGTTLQEYLKKLQSPQSLAQPAPVDRQLPGPVPIQPVATDGTFGPPPATTPATPSPIAGTAPTGQTIPGPAPAVPVAPVGLKPGGGGPGSEEAFFGPDGQVFTKSDQLNKVLTPGSIEVGAWHDDGRPVTAQDPMTIEEIYSTPEYQNARAVIEGALQRGEHSQIEHQALVRDLNSKFYQRANPVIAPFTGKAEGSVQLSALSFGGGPDAARSWHGVMWYLESIGVLPQGWAFSQRENPQPLPEDIWITPEMIRAGQEYGSLMPASIAPSASGAPTLEALRKTGGRRDALGLGPQPGLASGQSGGQFFDPTEAIQRLMNFTPQQFFGLLPSQVERLAGTISSLGVPPDDYFQSLFRGFPTGINSAQINFGNF